MPLQFLVPVAGAAVFVDNHLTSPTASYRFNYVYSALVRLMAIDKRANSSRVSVPMLSSAPFVNVPVLVVLRSSCPFYLANSNTTQITET